MPFYPATSKKISYTPGYGNLTIGDGVPAGEYMLTNSGLIKVFTRFQFGSTSAVTGNVQVGAPSGFTLSTSLLQFCEFKVWDASTSTLYHGLGNVFATSFSSFFRDGSGVDINATNPITFTTGDLIYTSGEFFLA